MPLDLTAFQNAVTRLAEGLEALRANPGDALIRDGAIQRFEFTYELAHKMLKRYLEMTSPNPAEFDGMAFSDLVRTGSEQGLLSSGWGSWKTFRHARSITSHTYDEGKALGVVELLPSFLTEARFLLDQLEARTQSRG
jgi:nucleotidyltransferase substrate binding protein (TIGR01987 family)